MQFLGYQIELNNPHEREDVVQDMMTRQDNPLMVLNTCQRLEFYGYGAPVDPRIQIRETFDAATAFERIARIAAGLESRILGELEVLGQVRNAYKVFHKVANRQHNQLDRIFQEALALGREARRKSGIDSKLTSLSGLAARELIERVSENAPVAVVGAGSLAGSVARYLRKRGNFPVRIASRCPDNALELAMEVEGFSAALDDLAPLLEDVAGIITATAAPHPLVFEHHLEKAKRPLTIIDLGVPADCCESLQHQDGITYISLTAIEKKAEINTIDRVRNSEVAARIITDGVREWASRH